MDRVRCRRCGAGIGRLFGITRVRNESLIIADTLRHYLKRCEHVLLYDDASTDDTAEIADSFDRVTVTRGHEWRHDRTAEETRHRGLMLEQARTMGAEWCLCFDADERLVGNLPDLKADGYRFRLFDGYLTADCQTLYDGGDLVDLPRMWGPEYRDILILFRVAKARFVGDDRREPVLGGHVELAPVFVKHFGKCLSVEHWEDTCAYYSTPLWPDRYRLKWQARKGKAIHTASDFGGALQSWDDLMRNPQFWTC